MRRTLLIAVLSGIFGCLLSLPALADEVYVATSNGDFLKYNTLTGSFTVLGTSSTPLFGMGFSGGVLYGNDSNAAPNTGFYTVNPGNGALTAVGTISGSTISGAGVLSAPVNGGTLYFADKSNDLYTINPSTAVATAVGPLGFIVGGGFEIVFGQNGNLYGASFGNLYSINESTGAGTLIGPTVFDGTQLGLQAIIAADGTLYGFHGAKMFSIDVSTGELTFIRKTPDPIDLGIFFDGTLVQVPEPSALGLWSTGILIGLAAWRKLWSSQFLR